MLGPLVGLVAGAAPHVVGVVAVVDAFAGLVVAPVAEVASEPGSGLHALLGAGWAGRAAVGPVVVVEDGLEVLAALAELAAEELRLAARALGQAVGRIDVEDVLDRVFREFCIGK